jgi:Na+-translocating ferredoxin:NAD+ oxidoreductase RnfG subunit
MNNSLRFDPIPVVAPIADGIAGPIAAPLAASIVGLIAAFTVPGAYAVDYLTIEQAQQAMFAQATAFEALPVDLQSAQLQAIAERAGPGLRPTGLAIWRARQGDTTLGYVVRDAVIGKFELISYAVAFGTDGKIRDVEILSYREAHGAEVRNASWREQFVGKSAAQSLSVGTDIDNISGATLSCTHLTEGIRRLASVVQVLGLHG